MRDVLGLVAVFLALAAVLVLQAVSDTLIAAVAAFVLLIVLVVVLFPFSMFSG